MIRRIVLTCLAFVLGIGLAEARAEEPIAEVAARAWAATEVVLARHVEPPACQQMLLAGLRAMARSQGVAMPADLACRVSELTGPGPLGVLMGEILAGPKADDREKAGTFDVRTALAGYSPDQAFFEGFGAAVPGGLTLMPEKERKVRESMEANLYVGVQVALGMDDKSKRPIFQQILEGGPAEAAGILAGDLIEAVDGQTTEGMKLGGAVDRLRGAEGTEVTVSLRRSSNGQTFERTMTRARLPRATVQGVAPLPGKRWTVRLDGPEPIGYLKINEISGSTPQELRAFASQLESEGLRALVLDLRNVGGAGFHPTVLLADALLDGGVIGKVIKADGETTYRAEPDALLRDWPMVVLVGGSQPPEVAWLGAALKANHRATVLRAQAGPISPQPDDAPFLEDIPLPGGDWTIRLATGYLATADGRPLSSLRSLPVGAFGNVADPRKKTEELLARGVQITRQTNDALAKSGFPPSPGEAARDAKIAAPLANARKAGGDLDLAMARGILAGSLKLPGK